MAVPAASWALGLGEIKLQSYLGQPFKASIPVLAGPDETIEETCFQVKPDNAGGLPGVAGINIVLQRQAGGARLLLTSRHSVNEPAVAISVITDCPQRLTRQYMVLLDPPVIMETPALPEAAAQAESRPIPLAHTAHTVKTAGHPAAARSRAKPARTHVHHATHPRLAGSSAPRLVLSGRTHAMTGTPSFGLRMDASPPSPGKHQVSPPGGVEVPDESASLNRKLDYLEKQLANLQRRNAELDQAARKTQALRPPPKAVAAGGNPWRSWLAGLALLTAGALLAWRWRSKRKTRLHFSATDLGSAPVAETRPAGQFEPLPEDTEVQVPAQDVPLAAAETTEPPAPLAPTLTAIVAKRLDKNRAENGVEVDDSVVDEVEVFVAHGHAELAINLLDEHLRIAPDESPIPWMLLLDLLKRQKLGKEYDRARHACKQHFNIRIPDLDEADPGSEAAGLEAYPHLLVELTRLWNTPECQTYLDDLIFDRRGGSRVGFDPPTYREIMLLRTMQGDESPPATARYRAY